MVGKIQKRLIFALAALLLALPLSAQKKEQTDSLVRLVKANSIELQEHMGRNYRKTVKATFLHNGTYLICDTALWNVEGKIINCWGNVQLIQDETVLTSEKLDYLVDEDLAQFRGRTVQLRNKKNNILRTRNLDYNTKDSVAVFRGGASMRDEDGQIIESREGTYESSRKLFTFRDNVNMFTDSVFVRTSNLIYDGERKTADFISYVDFWKDGNMLSAGKGWYRKDAELFFFEQDVHGLSEDQEIWCDSLYFYRNTQDVLMIGRTHVQDTSRHVAGMADRIMYTDSLAMVTMKGQAAVALRTEQENNANKIDTLYMGADSIQYRTRKMCDILDVEKKDAQSRLSAMSEDPVQAFRRKAAEAAAKKAEEAAKKDPNAVAKAAAEAKKKDKDAAAPDASGGTRRNQQQVPPQEQDDQQDDPQQSDGPSEAPKDSLGTSLDSLGTPKDSVIVPLDTTKVGFLVAVKNVKIFRTDMQVRCDSLRYCDLDSIARFYVKPIIWNDGNRQYTSDSLSVLIHDGGVDRASLMSNAFIITQEDSLYFDQIKGAEVMAYFDTTSALRRFDALGGATATFFLKENESIATVNKVDTKMLSAIMVDGELERVYYFDAPKNDAYPIVQLKTSELRMKGFNWDPDSRPKGKEDITSLRVKPTERDYYEGRPKAEFKQTEVYFPGHMKTVYEALEAARQRKREAQRRRQEAQNAVAAPDSLAGADSLSFGADSLSIPADSLLGKEPVADSLQPAGTREPENAPAVQPKQDPKPQAPAFGTKHEVKPEESPAKNPVARDTAIQAPPLMPPADSLRPVLPDSTMTVASEPVDSVALLKRLEKERRQKERWEKQAENERIRKEKQEKRELARKLAIARRDAKWAELDSLDAARQKLKDDRKDTRRRSRTRRLVRDQMVQDAKDEAKLQKYIERYTRRKERQEARRRFIIKSDKKNEQQEQPEPSGERSPETAARRELPAPPSRRPEAS